jgi:ketosteroid isomerase-like protein
MVRSGVVVLALWSCAPQPNAGPSLRAQGELMEADRAFARDVAMRRVDAWVDAFADSGAVFQPGGALRGHAAIRELMTPEFADTTFHIRWEPVEAHASPDGMLGYTIGRYVSTRRAAAGQVVERTGSYLTVWRRGADGVWKVEADIGNPDD